MDKKRFQISWKNNHSGKQQAFWHPGGCRMANIFKCLSNWSKNCTWGNLQYVISLLTLHKIHTQLNIFGLNFLDLLIKLMKSMLLYILYCPPPPPCDCKDLLILVGHPIICPDSLPPSHLECALKSVRDANTSQFSPWNLNLNSKSKKYEKN